MSSNIKVLPSGGTVWNLVKAANPKASESELTAKTNAVLKANNLTWETAKNLKAGSKINLGDTPDSSSTSVKSTSSSTESASSSKNSTSSDSVAKSSGAQAQAASASNNNSFDWLMQLINQGSKSGQSLDQYLAGQGAGDTSSSGSLANRTGGFAYAISGQQFLPFANPSLVLGTNYVV